MTLQSLIDSSIVSDAGGVAGRRGQKYQDHVAASLVIDMLEDVSILQIECETADDVTVRRAAPGNVTWNEYVQVKTTDGDSKWTLQELVARKDKREGTSIVERSLACDAHPGEPNFRLVTIREPRGDLRHFKIPRTDRGRMSATFALATKPFANKYPKFTSPNGRTLADWAPRLLWQVEADMERLAERNRFRLLKLASRHGERPDLSEIDDAYAGLLAMVVEAGDASRVEAPDAKAISRAYAVRWWEERIAAFAAKTRGVVKVYRVRTEDFFSDMRLPPRTVANRSLSAYDVEYDGGEWRRRELVEHLLDWIPEVVLPPTVLANLDHLSARTLLRRAVEACDAHGGLLAKELLAELMLHAILRHHHRSEPIACKVFHLNAGRLIFGNAHVVRTADGDQLWLGQTRLTTATDRGALPLAIAEALRVGLDREVLRRERTAILQLRHPAHLSAHDLGRSMTTNGRVDDLLSVLHVPLLIAYDSEILSDGFEAGYLEKLCIEAERVYTEVGVGIDAEFRETRIHIFLIPVECADTLAAAFDEALRVAR